MKNQNFISGQKVRYASPDGDIERDALFSVNFSDDGRTEIQWINSGMTIAPIETVSTKDLVSADALNICES